MSSPGVSSQTFVALTVEQKTANDAAQQAKKATNAAQADAQRAKELTKAANLANQQAQKSQKTANTDTKKAQKAQEVVKARLEGAERDLEAANDKLEAARRAETHIYCCNRCTKNQCRCAKVTVGLFSAVIAVAAALYFIDRYGTDIGFREALHLS